MWIQKVVTISNNIYSRLNRYPCLITTQYLLWLSIFTIPHSQECKTVRFPSCKGLVEGEFNFANFNLTFIVGIIKIVMDMVKSTFIYVKKGTNTTFYILPF